jgi:hypothetical protein
MSDSPTPQPQQPYMPNDYGQRPPAKTNTFAILALVFAFILHPLGAIFGHVSLGQIKRTGEEGRGLAIAGIAVGWSLTAIWVGFVALYSSILFIALASSF